MTLYSKDMWLHIYTDGSSDDEGLAKADFNFINLFKGSLSAGLGAINFDAEIEAVRQAICHLTNLSTSYRLAIFLIDSQSAINTLCSLCNSDSIEGEELETHLLQLQQEVEREREERNFYQLERDKIQLFWEVTKHQLEEKDAILQLKNSEIDEAALSHLAEIKLYKQKMKHVMFECQQHIDEKMKEKMDEKLILKEQHQEQVNLLESEMNKLKDEIFQFKIDHENAIINQRLQHGEELCSLHKKYQEEIDVLKSKEITEIGNIRQELDLQRKKAILEIENKKDAHIEHLIQTHEELFQKMKNYYNDIIKNDILLIKSLKDKIEGFLRKECHYKEIIKTLLTNKEELSNTLSNIQQLQSTESVIRNLQRELDNLKLENDSLFYQLQRIKEKVEPRKISCSCKVKEMSVQNEKSMKNHHLHFQQIKSSVKGLKNSSLVSNPTVNKKSEESLFKEKSFKCSSLNLLDKSQNK
ncbi:dynein regulatory complex subunit 4 [Trichonephila inaurata madagascariensis]|uniref:Dynein regulatory complex subunit 4 n=1 Tax=Trichonephila inaurata madagascariensis TaxID=2747483 RepID=A0A8X6X9R8_9ARAC|nr:dynein regulatory complex subunit 4 [Trichonephila inaurata madagascariensis]